MTAEEAAAALAHEGETVLLETGEAVPDPGNVVIPFKKIEEIMTERKTAAVEAEKKAAEQDKAEKKPPTPEQPPEEKVSAQE